VTVLKGLELAGILLNAANGVTDARETGARNQTDVTAANDSDIHSLSFDRKLSVLGRMIGKKTGEEQPRPDLPPPLTQFLGSGAE
jgi:hypothetical protein